ncbi:hypothetical protein KCU77_g965, partial [Aureobasidium melanogenum]
MFSRGHVYDYTLAPPGDRTGSPMLPHRIKKGWVGQTKEQLLAKSDFLPTGVRDCPRAFVVTPHEYLQRMRRKSSPDDERSWPLPATFWNLPPSLPPPGFPRPPPMVISDVVKYSTGEVEFSLFVWETTMFFTATILVKTAARSDSRQNHAYNLHLGNTGQWRHVYENNTLATFPYYQIDLAYDGNSRRSIYDFGSDDDDST